MQRYQGKNRFKSNTSAYGIYELQKRVLVKGMNSSSLFVYSGKVFIKRFVIMYEKGYNLLVINDNSI